MVRDLDCEGTMKRTCPNFCSNQFPTSSKYEEKMLRITGGTSINTDYPFFKSFIAHCCTEI